MRGGGVDTVALVSTLLDDVSCKQVLLTRDVVGSSEGMLLARQKEKCEHEDEVEGRGEQ